MKSTWPDRWRLREPLRQMVQEILTISRLDTAGGELKKDRFDCVQVIRRYLNETEDTMIQKDLQIYPDLPQEAFVNGNKMLMEKVFSNLIGNAIQYSPRGRLFGFLFIRKASGWIFPWKTAGRTYRRTAFRSCLTPFTVWSSPRTEEPEEAGWDCMSHRGSCDGMTVNAWCAIRHPASGLLL